MTSFQIECFLKAAKYLNFTEAANDLYIAQSSLSRNILNFEEEIGIQLFIRTKRYVRLTPAGLVLYNELPKLQKQFTAILEKSANADLLQEGTLCIGLIEMQRSENFLPQSIQILRDNYAHIKIELFRSNFKELRDALQTKKIDIALTLDIDLCGYDSNETLYEPFYESAGKCVLSKHHPLAHQDMISLEDLKDEALIAISPEVSIGAHKMMLGMCEMNGFIPKQLHLASSVSNLMLMVEAGLGFSVLDENCSFGNNPAIRLIALDHLLPLALVAVWNKSNLNPCIPLFVNSLLKHQSIENNKMPLDNSN